MSVRQSLLAILDQAPCYGYQLRGEFETRTGGTWPLNVGQVYTTLDRLERDGFVTRDGADVEGRVRYAITDAGSSEVRGWLAAPVVRQQVRDELAMKLAIACTLPGIDVPALIQTQRTATLAVLQDLTRTKSSQAAPASPSDLAWSLVVESMIFAVEAEARWLDHAEATIARAARSGAVAAVEVPRAARRIVAEGGAR
ncbi:PadR family transcriptional regulator [uncultured Amnibacterium sp.]|uniref:PadR family transcriptional regulator n=1 Tax=uncultured Amnibacterium sp. TaxID=1631851 RepID=UPI0035CBD4D4